MTTRDTVLLLCLVSLILSLTATVRAEQGQVIRLLTPIPGGEVIAKHPDIQAVFTARVDPQSLVVLLDDTDITATVELTGQGFRCQAPIILPAGQHTLYVAGNSDQGYFEQQIPFSSRQYASVDEAYSNNQWTLNLQAGNIHRSHGDDATFTGLDTTLQTDSVVSKGPWRISLSGNARLLDQSSAIMGYSGDSSYGPAAAQGDGGVDSGISDTSSNPSSINPVRRGLDLNTVLLQAQYQKNGLLAAAELGDMQIDTSPNTFSMLARNGGRLRLDAGTVFLEGFSVFGRDTFGLRNGFGIGFDNDNHVNGLTGGIRILNRKVEIKGLYFDGGQKENGYSSWAQEQANRGRLWGAILKTEFLDQALSTEFEYDRSDFDPNTEDEFSGSQDEAYRLRIGGQKDIYTYDLTWERFGPGYDLPGAMSPKKDYEGLTLSGGAQGERQGLNLMLSAYRNNVEDDPLYAVINSLSGQVDYTYYGLANFPLTFSYQHTRDLSGDEPEDSQETDLNTDAMTIGVGYNGTGVFSADFTTTYSWQDDKSSQDADLSTLTLMLTPSLNFATFSMSMSGGLNQSRDLLTGTRTDEYTLTLDAMGTLLADVFSYEFGGTYDHSLVNDDSGDRSTVTGYGRLSYHLPWMAETLQPALGLELQYSNSRQPETESVEETRIFCTLSTSMDFRY